MGRMSNEDRERLREHATANKGRTNLMGLDRTLGLAALDYVQEQSTKTLAGWNFRASGHSWYDVSAVPYLRILLYDLKTAYDEGRRVRSRYSVRCSWVRLSYAPQWLKDEFANRWGARQIVYTVRGILVNAPVFPLGPVMEFLRFIWPGEQRDGLICVDYENLEDRAKRYLTGYSEGYCLRWPGVGQSLRFADGVRKVTSIQTAHFTSEADDASRVERNYGEAKPDWELA